MRLISLVSVLTVFLTFSLLAHAQEIENLLSNPDFEEGTNGWRMNLGGGAVGQIKAEEGGVVGDLCMHAIIDSLGNEDWQPEIHSPEFDVKAGERYTCAFWAKTEEGKSRMIYVKFEQLDTWQGPGQQFNITDEWTEYHFSPMMTVQSPPKVVIHIDFRATLKQKEDVWFDHFRVYKGEYIEEKITVGEEGFPVNPRGKLASVWAKVKTE